MSFSQPQWTDFDLALCSSGHLWPMLKWGHLQPFYTISRKHTWRMFILRNQALSNGGIPEMLGNIKDQSYQSFYHLLVALICVSPLASVSEAPSSLPLIPRRHHCLKQVCREFMFGTFCSLLDLLDATVKSTEEGYFSLEENLGKSYCLLPWQCIFKMKSVGFCLF